MGRIGECRVAACVRRCSFLEQFVAMTEKPIPIPTPSTQPYWDGLDRGELVIQHCSSCCKYNFYPRVSCPTCGTRQLVWVAASGRARLHTFVINHRPAPGFNDESPYVIAVVELEEGPRLMTNLRGIAPDPDHLQIDMELEVCFEERGGRTLAMFRPLDVAS
jgi:uncharacterized protein